LRPIGSGRAAPRTTTRTRLLAMMSNGRWERPWVVALIHKEQ
jgi:hypothetical protein